LTWIIKLNRLFITIKDGGSSQTIKDGGSSQTIFKDHIFQTKENFLGQIKLKCKTKIFKRYKKILKAKSRIVKIKSK
jgi:hypothetical protein